MAESTVAYLLDVATQHYLCQVRALFKSIVANPLNGVGRTTISHGSGYGHTTCVLSVAGNDSDDLAFVVSNVVGNIVCYEIGSIDADAH